MSSGHQDPMDVVRGLATSYRGVKFGRGVVGKTSYAMLALFGLWALILFRLSDNLIVDALLLGAGVAVTLVYMWWVKKTQKFAVENPGLAMLEGAQFLEYQKWEAGIKGLPPLNSPRIPDPSADHRAIDSREQQ
ncbi:MAG TPA: hypothetical protein VGQ22_20425 [Steroidobacteraceae bacterium]|nr:hypothetical protein [Steroidobacteraceae bacterium]